MCFRGLHWWDSGRVSSLYSSKMATVGLCGQSMLEAVEQGDHESSGQCSTTRTRTQTRGGEKRLASHRAGLKATPCSAGTTWWKWTGTHCVGLPGEGTPRLRWSFLSMKKCVSVWVLVCLCVKTYIVNRSCHRNCCHVAVNRLSDLKSQSNWRTAKKPWKVLLWACADVHRRMWSQFSTVSNSLKTYSRQRLN